MKMDENGFAYFLINRNSLKKEITAKVLFVDEQQQRKSLSILGSGKSLSSSLSIVYRYRLKHTHRIKEMRGGASSIVTYV